MRGLERLTHPWLGFCALVAVCLPLILWRAQLETSFWIDEVYSVVLASYPVADLIEMTASDAHPPGYYLALKAWIKLGHLLGGDPGVFWARLLNVGLWLLLAAGAWLGGRRLLGPRDGTLLAWGVAAGASAPLVAREIRGYGLASVALFVAFLALLLAVRDPGCHRKQAVFWAIYAVAASLALWAHLLAAIVLAWLSLLWAALFGRREHWRKPFLTAALVGHLTPILAYLPWLLRLKEQLAFLDRSQPEWMTPPTLANLGWVFTFWYPFGRLGDPLALENRGLVPLGIVAVLAPVAVALLAALAPAARLTVRPAALGLGTSLLFVGTLWTLHRLGVSYTFHGPRYPLLAANLFAAGLVFAILAATSRFKRRRPWAILFVLPWLLSSALGQGLLAAREARWGLANVLSEINTLLPAKGDRLYVMPSELIPYYRRSLREFEARRIEELPCEARGEAVVLDVNFWKNVDRPRDHLVRYLIEKSLLAGTVSQRKFPESQKDYVIYRLDGLDEVRLRELCANGLSSRFARELAGAASAALAENQHNTTFWSFVETGAQLEMSRWSISPMAPVIFDRPLAAGNYVLHVMGYREPYPLDPQPMTFKLRGSELAETVSVGSGSFDLEFPLRLERSLRRPVLLVEHDLWSPAEVSGSKDARKLSFLLYAAWFEAAPAN